MFLFSCSYDSPFSQSSDFGLCFVGFQGYARGLFLCGLFGS